MVGYGNAMIKLGYDGSLSVRLVFKISEVNSIW